MYNLSSLYFISKNIYNIKDNNVSLELLDSSKHVKEPTNPICYPIKIYMKNILQYQREIFEIIQDKYKLIEELPNNNNEYEIVTMYGDSINNGFGDHYMITVPFLRDLFKEKIDFKMIKGARIFITRKNSEKYHKGVKKRCITNEDEMKDIFAKYNIQVIQLEELTGYEKMKLFMESELIISTHGSQLTFAIFANTKCKIIEILNRGTIGVPNNHIRSLCNCINLNYNRYSNINEDHNGNFELNMLDFEKYLLTII